MWENLPLVLIVIGLILLLSFFRRGRRAETKPVEIVQRLLAEVRLNLRLTEIFTPTSRMSRFMTTSWQINKNKLDFMDQPLQVTLSEAYTMAEDFNQQITAAKKHRSANYMASVDTRKLKEKLIKSREGLEEWLNSKVGTTELPWKIPGIFDDWLGKG